MSKISLKRLKLGSGALIKTKKIMKFQKVQK